MRRDVIGFAGFLITALSCGPAAAYFHAGGGSWSASSWRGSASGGGGSWSASGYRGGSASGGDGSWSGSGWRGGSASGGDGSWHGTGAYGGTASGGGGSWHATSPYATTSYSSYGHYYGGTYATYHPPTVVNTYYGSGCSSCGGWSTAGAAAAGAAVGLAAGTAIGAANANAASANAYAAGVAAGSAYAMGAIYPTLPAGCVYSPVSGLTYYDCNGTWMKPSFGANGVYYRVVPIP